MIRASSASCTYSGTPEQVIKAIEYPLTSPVSFVGTSLATYSSSDTSDTNCPLNQLIQYLPDGSGNFVFKGAGEYSGSQATITFPAGETPGLKQNFRALAGLVNVFNVLVVQPTDTEVKLYVCGLETLALAASAAYDFVGTVSSADATIAPGVFNAWFTVDGSASGATTSCVVNKYELFESDKSTAVVNTVASIDASTGNLVIKQTAQAAKASYWVKATTMGSKTQFKELTI